MADKKVMSREDAKTMLTIIGEALFPKLSNGKDFNTIRGYTRNDFNQALTVLKQSSPAVKSKGVKEAWQIVKVALDQDNNDGTVDEGKMQWSDVEKAVKVVEQALSVNQGDREAIIEKDLRGKIEIYINGLEQDFIQGGKSRKYYIDSLLMLAKKYRVVKFQGKGE